MCNFIIYALYEQVRIRKPAKRCLFLIPNLRTAESIEKQRKKRPKGRFEFLAAPSVQFTSRVYERIVGVWERIKRIFADFVI